MKIIKLTENDLKIIVKKILKEQQIQSITNSERNIWKESPFKSTQEGNIFRKWMNDNYPKFSKSMKLDPTGSYNNSYIKMVYMSKAPNTTSTFGQIFSQQSQPSKNKYQLDIPTGYKTDSDTTDTTYQKSFAKSIERAEKAFKEGITPYKDKLAVLGVPCHFRVFFDFLNNRSKDFTMADLTKEEQKVLGHMLYYAENQKLLRNGESLSFYNLSNKMNNDKEQIEFTSKNLGVDQLNITNGTTKIAMMLGNATPTKIQNGYLITDIYDFNNFYNHPEKYKFKELPNTLKDSLVKIWGGNYIQGLEQLASYKHKLGYKGFNVKLSVPITLVKPNANV